MVLSDISIQRPVLAVVLNALLVVFGIFAFTKLPVREYPSVDPPVVSISTNYEGASAEVIETQITQMMEGAVSGVEGIKTIRSTSREGSSNVRIEFLLTRDIEGAANDVRDRVSRAARSLPDEADAPVIAKVDSDSSPILWATLTSEQLSRLELTDYARRVLVDRITAVPGVADVRISGQRIYAMRVWLDRNALAARNLTVQDVETALRRENAELPAGRIESAQREFTVRTDTRLSRAEQFSRIVISQRSGNFIRLGDVARIELGTRDDRGDYTVNARAAVGLGVTKQATANTMDVAEGVKALLRQVGTTLPADAAIDVSFDESVFIAESIYQVFHALTIALGLVVLVTWVFLRDLRATVIPAVAIPVSIVAAFTVLAALGYSINVLTLLALVLAIGLVVDDAIIVVENVSRRIDLGEPPLLAAYRGAGQIGFAVIATTAVLIAVIFPLVLLQDTVGRFFKEFAVTLGAAVAFSALVALTLTPMMCSQVLRGQHGGVVFRLTERFFDGMTRVYSRLLDGVLAAPVLMLALLGALTGATWYLFTLVPQEFTPPEDRGSFRITVTAPEGASQDYTRREMGAVEGILAPYRESGEIASVLAILNPGWGGQTGVNRATIQVRLAPWDRRVRSQAELMAELRGKLQAVPGARVAAFAGGGIARSGALNQVQMVLGGSSYEELAVWRDLLIERLRDEPGFGTIQANYDETKPQLRVTVDRDRAADLGLGTRDIGETLETLVGGRAVTRFTDRGEEYDVMVQATASDRADPRDLSNIFLRAGSSEKLVPLSSVVTVRDVAGPSELGRVDRLRAITVTANLEGIAMGTAIDVVRRAAAEVLPGQVRLSFDGSARELQESSAAIYFAFGMALLIAFLVLAAQFESFTLPSIVMLTVPLALFGGLAAIVATAMTLNIYTQIGLVMLIGLIAKNAILIVEFANQMRDEGRAMDVAIREAAATRLRPILMTSIATVFGAVPLAMAEGAGAESRMAIGLVIVGGVSVGSLLSLFGTPLLYSLLARRLQPIGRIRRRIQELELQHAKPKEDVPAE
ncbi:efflux RND transporter permease subunit [Skermanella pratensis]|uniref:efflux RND transporter permease subunit n=1 Tax=Skermanella pratensis TaxID=2233999 RepID=UPI001301418E|nr:efflux RND transporter permease subunit [Skermanella pratensis]